MISHAQSALFFFLLAEEEDTCVESLLAFKVARDFEWIELYVIAIRMQCT